MKFQLKAHSDQNCTCDSRDSHTQKSCRARPAKAKKRENYIIRGTGDDLSSFAFDPSDEFETDDETGSYTHGGLTPCRQ